MRYKSEWSKWQNKAPQITNVLDHGCPPMAVLVRSTGAFLLKGKLAALWSNSVAWVSFSDTEKFSLETGGAFKD